MRFVKSNKSPYILRLIKNKIKCPVELFNEQCFVISTKIAEIRDIIDQSDFPSEEFKELIQKLQDLKKIDIPTIKIPYTALNILETECIDKFFKNKLEKQTRDLSQKSEIAIRQKKFLNELDNQDLDLK